MQIAVDTQKKEKLKSAIKFWFDNQKEINYHLPLMCASIYSYKHQRNNDHDEKLSTQHRITRNISFFKMLPRKGNYKQYENSADNDADDNESIDLRPREWQVARRYPVKKRGRPNYFHEER